MARGAEAILYRKDGELIKKRIKKSYRIEEIDTKLRKERTNREVRLLIEAKRNGVNVPSVIKKDIKNTKIIMEFIDGEILRDKLESLNANEFKNVCKQIGESISKLHKAGIVHGDLTTSNMMLKDGKVYFIDFGLGRFSSKIEDFAVDLHLLKEALIAKHNKTWERALKEILSNYSHPKKDGILKRLEEIEKRGRYSKRVI